MIARATILTTTAVLATLFSPGQATAADLSPGPIRAVHVTGSAKRGDGKDAMTPLKEGDAVATGETVQVGSGPSDAVDLKFPEGHQVRLKPGSKFRIEAGGKTLRILQLMQGKMFMHFQKGAEPKSVEIRTNTAVAGVRGTQFMVEVDEKKGSYFCVCEGAIGVGKPGEKEKTRVAQGQDIWVKADKPLGTAVDSPNMSNMTRQEFSTMTY